MINPIILVAILVQSAIRQASPVAGAVVGFVITTGILLWGLSLYGNGDQIAFFGVPLPQSTFVLACLLWYGFDMRQLAAAKMVQPTAEEPAERP
jgi:hypothetical protein